jgi:TonB family protein
MLKPFCAVAVITLWVSAGLTQAMADDAPASSGASALSCEYGQPSDINTMSPEVLAVSRTVFMKICGLFNGELLNGRDSHSGHLKQPGKIIGTDVGVSYPPVSMMRHETGTVVMAFVVETDGRVSREALLKSSGYPNLDNAALASQSSVRYETPAYLDDTPVRVYLVRSINYQMAKDRSSSNVPAGALLLRRPATPQPLPQ